MIQKHLSQVSSALPSIRPEELPQAVKAFTLALQLKPDNKNAKKELQQAEESVKKHLEMQADLKEMGLDEVN